MRVLAYIVLAPLLALSFLLACCPPRMVGAMGKAAGGLLSLVGFRKKIVLENLRLALGKELSESERAALANRIYAHIGTLFLEIARNFGLSREQMRRELLVREEDLSAVHKIIAQGPGAIFITGHIANWELFAMGISIKGVPTSLVVKKMNNAISQVLIERLRKRTDLGIIYSGKALEKMKAACAERRAIGFMVDQNTTGTKGIRANFFGVPAASIRGLAKLTRETGTPVVPICSFRNSEGLHEVKLFPALPYLRAPELAEGSPERIAREEWLNTQAYQTAIEAMVRERPEQWMWIHRRWKTSRETIDPELVHRENIGTLG